MPSGSAKGRLRADPLRQLQLNVCAKCIAGIGISGFIPLREPAPPLLGSAVGEAVRVHPPAAAALEPVVADCLRRIEGLLQVARFELVDTKPTTTGVIIATYRPEAAA